MSAGCLMAGLLLMSHGLATGVSVSPNSRSASAGMFWRGP
jgi:hypothetical protein